MQVAQVLGSVSGNTFVGVSTKTVPVLAGGKKNPMQGRVTKIMEGASCQVFSNQASNGYANKVARRLEAEGKNPEDFQLSARVWGERVPGAPLVKHNGKMYAELVFLNSGKVHYELDGQPIEKSEIVGLKEVCEADQGGLSDENKVILRTFAEESITQLKINGHVYR